ncbi:MAG: hypothetical protein BWX64_02517 [Acidobacteria bacterium ADurb.Bin051]|nr:MAG: hypothetical protein BWX64_02517 [Acidobacteria bacterium ADurb.Bin051]
MAPGLRLLRPEGGAEAVDLAEGGDRRLEIELARLREIRLVAEVVGREERRGPLARRGGEDRRVDPDEVALVVEVVDPLLDLAAHPQRRPLPARTEPEVAVLHQEGDAMLLRGDREVVREVIDPEVGEEQLEAARGAAVGPHRAHGADRRLLRHPLHLAPGLGREVLPAGDRLDDAGAVAELEEGDLAARALLDEPAAQGDRLALVGAVSRDRNHRGSRVAHRRGIIEAASSDGQGESPSAASAAAAAACSAVFFVRPEPTPSTSAPARQRIVNRFA